MEFQVQRDVLSEAVAWVVRGLTNRPPVPVLAGVRLVADPAGTLTLSAFDYEVSGEVTVEADVVTGGEALVLGRLLSEISRSLPDKPVRIEQESGKLQVTCGSSRFALLEMPLADYPSLPSAPEGSGTVDGALFTKAVAQVSVAADRSDALPILTGVHVEFDGERITMLATDRYRMARRELTWTPRDPSAHHVALVPSRTLSDTAKSLGAVGSVDIALGDEAGGKGLIGFSAGQRHSTTRLLDGEYPKVSSIFPTTSDTDAVMETAALIEAIKRVSLVAERTTPVRLRFTPGSVAIEAGTGDDAQASEAVECTLDGDEIDVAFNPGFLLDGLGALGTPFARMSFTQPGKPALLTGQAEGDGEADDSFSYVIMPVRFPGA
ncbi:DNA polymerase III subunit beta [Kytococcus sedentarius]|uniref:DNA polymerase III subunit beta n=1 Tax=Kytococcus sedentarius TaxID=1276 RepID=UPI0035BBD7FC